VSQGGSLEVQVRSLLYHLGVTPKHQKLDEHIRERRLDLGLFQIEVAKMIGVTESTAWNWSITRRGAWDRA